MFTAPHKTGKPAASVSLLRGGQATLITALQLPARGIPGLYFEIRSGSLVLVL